MKKKIKIPDGYEMISNEGDLYIPKRQGDAILSTTQPSLIIPLKKKQPEHKNFSWYYMKYLESKYSIIPFKSEKLIDLCDLVKEFEIKRYNNIPFEFRIGLLKFICDSNDIELIHVLYYIYGTSLDNIECKKWKKIRDIIPKEFLETFK